MAMKLVRIWTDGACKGNPGPGGWGAILDYNGRRKEISGASASTTNNRMELAAIIEALKALKEPCEVHLTTDSRYIIDAVGNGWLEKWKANGWLKADKKPAVNQDLWKQVDALMQVHTIKWAWVKGHAGHAENERCDVLANIAIATMV